jgi:hypothetical protein
VRVFLQNRSLLSSQDNDFVTKLEYLDDIFDKMNSLNMSLQGCITNVLVLSDKINGFMKKLELWKSRVKNGNVEIFSLVWISGGTEAKH